MDKISYVHTREEHCIGCNKCIFVCPTRANVAFFEAENNKVSIKPGHCISCGECINICDHSARDYEDDTQRFFDDLKNNEQISAVIAPSATFNYSSNKKLTGYLKSIGVNKVYDVSFGADICSWGHVKVIKEQEQFGIIAQPCPVVVSYIEKYRPEYIKNLSPVQSPVACLAIYLKKYLGVKDKLVFISPCIGKKRECMDENTHGVLEYNVTFTKLDDYLTKNGIEICNYPEEKFDIAESSLGFTFPRPGGLSENIKLYLGENIWVKRVEGIANIKEYLNEFSLDLSEKKPVPRIIDALNCEHGCNLGTGTKKNARQNTIDYTLNNKKSLLDRAEADKLLAYFDEKLSFEDFVREYLDKSPDYKPKQLLSIEEAFASIGKYTDIDKNINCFSCGYGSCLEFVRDIANGNNNKNNCKFYLLNKFKKLSLYDELTGLNNRNCFNGDYEKYEEEHPGIIGIVYIDINGLKQANDMYGHGYGDSLIMACANILKKVFDSGAYRVGGDEFVVLLPVDKLSDFYEKVEYLNDLLKNEKELVASVGISVSRSTNDLVDKMDEADKEMYKAKEKYYNSIQNVDRRKNRLISIKKRKSN